MSKPNKRHKEKCQSYKTSGRRAINKDAIQKKLAAGKKIRSRRPISKQLTEKMILGGVLSDDELRRRKDSAWDRLIRSLPYQYAEEHKNDTAEEKKNKKKVDLIPKNLNKNCIR